MGTKNPDPKGDETREDEKKEEGAEGEEEKGEESGEEEEAPAEVPSRRPRADAGPPKRPTDADFAQVSDAVNDHEDRMLALERAVHELTYWAKKTDHTRRAAPDVFEPESDALEND